MEIRTNNFIQFCATKKCKKYTETIYEVIIPNDIILGRIISDTDLEKNHTIINIRRQIYHPFINDTAEKIKNIIEDTSERQSYPPSLTGDGYYLVLKQELVEGERLNITDRQYIKYVDQQRKKPKNNSLTREVEQALKKLGLNDYIIKTAKRIKK